MHLQKQGVKRLVIKRIKDCQKVKQLYINTFSRLTLTLALTCQSEDKKHSFYQITNHVFNVI